MKIVKISQSKETEAWLQHRLGKITGSKAKFIKPLSRGADRTPQGFWQLLSEKICVRPDGEPDLNRGQRLQEEALSELAKRRKLDIDTDCGMWVSDENEDMAVSPDGAEKSSAPTWAAEVKCLSSPNHLKYIVKHRLAKQASDYSPINSIPNDAKNAYKDQVIQYFVVNESLTTLYFVLYDDRVGIDHLTYHEIVVKRSDIEELIAAQRDYELNLLKDVNALIAELVEE